mgnify:CR=1 FL=1
MKTLESYSFIRGFNHEPNFFTYTHEEAEKELGYAKQLPSVYVPGFLAAG